MFVDEKLIIPRETPAKELRKLGRAQLCAELRTA
jgi:hypothetical protein